MQRGMINDRLVQSETHNIFRENLDDLENLTLVEFFVLDEGNLFLWVNEEEIQRMNDLDHKFIKKILNIFGIGKKLATFSILLCGYFRPAGSMAADLANKKTENSIIVYEKSKLPMVVWNKDFNSSLNVSEREEIQRKNNTNYFLLEIAINENKIQNKNELFVDVKNLKQKNSSSISQPKLLAFKNSSFLTNKNLLLKGGKNTKKIDLEQLQAQDQAKRFFTKEKIPFQERVKLLSNLSVVREILRIFYQNLLANFQMLIHEKKFHKELVQIIIKNPAKIVFGGFMVYNSRTIGKFVFNPDFREKIFSAVNDQLVSKVCKSVQDTNLSLTEIVKQVADERDFLWQKISMLNEQNIQKDEKISKLEVENQSGKNELNLAKSSLKDCYSPKPKSEKSKTYYPSPSWEPSGSITPENQKKPNFQKRADRIRNAKNNKEKE